MSAEPVGVGDVVECLKVRPDICSGYRVGARYLVEAVGMWNGRRVDQLRRDALRLPRSGYADLGGAIWAFRRIGPSRAETIRRLERPPRRRRAWASQPSVSQPGNPEPRAMSETMIERLVRTAWPFSRLNTGKSFDSLPPDWQE